MAKTTYMWDELSDNVAAEYDDGVLAAAYTHEPDLYGNLLSQNRNGITSYYHYDGRGDTVALTDDSGNITDTKEYDAWGNVIASTGSTVTPYQFGGQKGFQTGITGVYTRGRYYAPTNGRITSRFNVAQLLLGYQPLPLISIASGTLLKFLTDESTSAAPEVLSVSIVTRSVQQPSCRPENAIVKWKFSLSGKAPCNGFLVQKVTVSCKELGCDCNNIDVEGPPFDPIQYSYFEAWRIEEKKDVPTTYGGIDTALVSPLTCTKGRYSQSGQVRFFCNAEVGLPPESTDTSVPGWNPVGTPIFYGPESAPKNCKTTAGKLTSRNGDLPEPEFWTPFGLNLAVKENHRGIAMEWECCPRGGNCNGKGVETASIEVHPDKEKVK